MLASIWLQLAGEQERMLRCLIESLAAQHGTVPFQPHLTVCGVPALTPASNDMAADFVRRSCLLPFKLRRIGISYSTTTLFKALVVDLENTAELDTFRKPLRDITEGHEPEPPHISLLYPIDGSGRTTKWASSEGKLRAIAEECAARIETVEFVLDDPVIVTTDGSWTNIASWKTVRAL